MTTPYYTDPHVTLYHGDMRELLPELAATERADAIVTDPPYGDTKLPWDRWPDGWPALAAQVTNSLWCFGSMRMFLQHWPDLAAAEWQLSQDIVWEKHNGSGFAKDRFRRVHEHAVHLYRGKWQDIHHATPREAYHGPRVAAKRTLQSQSKHQGEIGVQPYNDDGTRLMRSVLRARSMQGTALHPTEKPVTVLTPLLKYAVLPGGLVLDPFAGSGSTLLAARLSGRRAIGIEVSEEYCRRAAARLAEPDLLTLEVPS